jgi:hypothetical protein
VSFMFDLRRINTVVGPGGRVHITEGSLWTLCGIDLSRSRHRFGWDENYGDRQPDCIRCVGIAARNPALYPFVKPVTPADAGLP